MTTGLVRYEAMLHAIANAYTVDEVKEIHDKARAAEIYARQAKNIEAERKVCEIRLRAERKAGQMLAQMEKAKAGRPPDNPSGDARDYRGAKTLQDMGISYDQSASWQRLAAVPDEEFEAALSGPKKPSTTGIVKTATSASVQYRVDDDVLKLHGMLQDFERHRLLDKSPEDLFERAAPFMRAEIARLAPVVGNWLLYGDRQK